MIELDIKPYHIKKIKDYYDFKNAKNSFTKGMSQDYGALAEILIIEYYNIPASNIHGTADYDILYDNKKVDIKAKKVSSKPLSTYFSSIAHTSFHQKCDEYVFVRVNKNMTKAWICGWISKQDFFTKGQYFCEGEVDPTSVKGFKFKQDCLNVPIYELEDRYIGTLNHKFFEDNFAIKKNQYFIETEYMNYLNFKGEGSEFKIIYQNDRLVVIKKNNNKMFDGYVKNISDFKRLFKENFLIDII